MKRKLVFPVIVLSSILLSGCLFGTNSSKLVPTESITTTEETTTEITSAETTTETTVETTETTVETSETSETTENTTTSEESSATKGTTKATNKTPTKTQEKKTTKPASKSATKAPATSTKKPTATPTKKPAATKAPTNTPKPTEKPKPTATPVPEKGYAIIKVKVTSHAYIDDESDEVEKHVDYFEIKAYTKKYHSKKPSDYHYDGDIIADKMEKKYGNNIQNFSAKNVEVIKFTN
ncbi:MAG: hypothetical protein E7386_04275 [Ruminococcaceae bacterium]|nr:hypothetical protein [Oscillospiraceae bacterium]